MNAFLFSAIALCLVAQGGLANYQQQQSGGYGQQTAMYQQRKMAPSPQQYGEQASQYGEAQTGYGAPTAVSSYDERTPAAGGYQAAAAKSTGYSQPAASYARQAAYAKPAAKYEEPYHPPMPFAWGYDINDGYGGAQYHKESGDEYGKRTGSYGYTDAYGVYRQVDYVADEHGFRATIKTNEPGTSNESPADVEMHAYEPPSNYYAGQSYQQQQQQKSYAAPAAAQSYSAPAAAQTYSAPAAQTYSAPATQSYQQAPAAKMTSYQQMAKPSYQQQQQSSYQTYKPQQQQSYAAPSMMMTKSYSAPQYAKRAAY